MSIGHNAPGRLDLLAYQGDDHQVRVTLADVDTDAVLDPTGITWSAQIREASADSGAKVVAQMSIGFDGMTLVLNLPGAVSQALAYGPYVWDLQGMLAPGYQRTFLRGAITLPRQITL